MDTAAEDAVVGSKALQLLSTELATFGLRYVPVSLQQAIPCAGIGGSATVTQLVDMPTCVAGILGVVRFSVVEDSESFSTPPLLPISYLEAIRALIDLSNNVLATPDGHRTPMVRLPSGHRAVNILDFNQTEWQLPDQFRPTDGSDPFQLPAASANMIWGGVTGVNSAVLASATSATSVPSASMTSPSDSSRTSPSSLPMSSSMTSPSDSRTSPSSLPMSSSMTSPSDSRTSPSSLPTSSSMTSPSDFRTSPSSLPGVSSVAQAYRISQSQESIESMQGAEELAKTLGISRDFSYEAMQSVLDRLPTKLENNREVTMRAKSPTATSWVFGLYVRGNMTGVTRAAVLMPEVTKYGNLWIADKFPGQEWSSWTANINMVAKVHIDTHNHKQAPNHTVSFGRFAKGELWLEVDDARVDGVRWKQKGGKRVPGILQNTNRCPTTFDPHRYHGTMPW